MDRLLEATARAERDHFWFRGFRRFIHPLLRESARAAGAVRILDCGCGTGNNLHVLRHYGSAIGIDITWSGLAYARGLGERQVARASATSLPFPAERFDLVTSFDVLYALDDEMERAALDEMFRVLRPGGQPDRERRRAQSPHSATTRCSAARIRRYRRRELARSSRRGPASGSAASATRTSRCCRWSRQSGFRNDLSVTRNRIAKSPSRPAP